MGVLINEMDNTRNITVQLIGILTQSNEFLFVN